MGLNFTYGIAVRFYESDLSKAIYEAFGISRRVPYHTGTGVVLRECNELVVFIPDGFNDPVRILAKTEAAKLWLMLNMPADATEIPEHTL